MAKDAAPKRPSDVPGEDTELTTPELNRGLANAVAVATFRKAGLEGLARSRAAKVFDCPRQSTNNVVYDAVIEAMDTPLGSVEILSPQPGATPTVDASGLIARDWQILRALAESQVEMTQTELAAKVDCDEKTLRGRLKVLEPRKLVGPPPGRANGLVITSDGRQVLLSR